MAQIPTFTLVAAGTAPTYGAAAAGDTAICGDGCFLVAKNASVSSVTLTVVTPGNLRTGVAYPDTTYTIAANTGEVWVPLYADYADPADGLAHLTWSATTSVTRAAIAT